MAATTPPMTELERIQASVASLPPEKLAAFREWFEAFKADLWDRQIEEDVKAGRLDDIAARVRRDVEAGRYTEL